MNNLIIYNLGFLQIIFPKKYSFDKSLPVLKKDYVRKFHKQVCGKMYRTS